MYKELNLNPYGKRVGDCTVRAIAAATGKSWEEVYTALICEGFALCDMPSANRVWGSYLLKEGWHRFPVPGAYPDFYTVSDFAKENPDGTYILCMASHVVCVKDGVWIDTWDSGDETPLYYWKKW